MRLLIHSAPWTHIGSACVDRRPSPKMVVLVLLLGHTVHKMRPVAVACSVCLSVCLSVGHTWVSCAKTAEPIEMLFGA